MRIVVVLFLLSPWLLMHAASTQPFIDCTNPATWSLQLEQTLTRALNSPPEPHTTHDEWLAATLPTSCLPQIPQDTPHWVASHWPAIAVIGADPTSIAWLKTHQARLTAHQGSVWVIHAESLSDLRTLKQHVVHLPLGWGSDQLLREQAHITHYPVLLLPRPPQEECP